MISDEAKVQLRRAADYIEATCLRVSGAIEALDDMRKVLRAGRRAADEYVMKLDSLKDTIAAKERELQAIEETIGMSQSQRDVILRQLRIVIDQAITTIDGRIPYSGEARKAFAKRAMIVFQRRLNDVIAMSKFKSSRGDATKLHEAFKQVQREQRAALAQRLQRARSRLRELNGKIETKMLSASLATWQNDLKLAFKTQGVPPPMIEASTLRKPNGSVPERSGIYFVWEGGVVRYIGKSVNLRNRLTLGHNKIFESDSISWLFFDVSDVSFAEAFYIGVCRPHRNGFV